MQRTVRRGFTLVEMVVVMAIIAVLAVLGISGLLAINNNNVSDRAAEELVGAIREAQNKAISVASAPGSPTTFPAAWGVRVNSTNGTVETFYVGGDARESASTVAFEYPTISISVSGPNTLLYATPFGKYYSTSENPLIASNWKLNGVRPYDLTRSVASTNQPTTITLTYRNSTRSVMINPAGDANVQ